MPSKDVHQKVSKTLGYDAKVDRAIDRPWKVLGSKHRVLFHKPEDAIQMGMMIDGARGAMGALAHITVDKEASANKDLRLLLEFWARMGASKPGINVYWDGLPDQPKKVKVKIRNVS